LDGRRMCVVWRGAVGWAMRRGCRFFWWFIVEVDFGAPILHYLLSTPEQVMTAEVEPKLLKMAAFSYRVFHTCVFNIMYLAYIQ